MKNFDYLFNNGCSKPSPSSCGCETVKGNAVEVQLQKDDCEVRADIVVGKTNSVRIWGQVKGCDGSPVSNALIKLIKVVYRCGRYDFEGIAHTISDCTGFYQFDVSPCEVSAKYRILVHKAATGAERVIPVSSQQCNPCIPPQESCAPPTNIQHPHYQPCQPCNEQ